MAMDSKATDGNTSQWDKLKAARGEHGTPVVVKPLPEAAASVVPAADAKPPQERNADGTFKAGEAAPEVVPAATAVPPADSAPPPAVAALAVPPPPADTSVEIEIDGVKVRVDPTLAEAVKSAQQSTTDATKAAERESLKAELRNELKAELQPQKSPADLAAEKALEEAVKAAAVQKPKSELLISDPDEYQKQNDVWVQAQITAAIERTKAETAKTSEAQQQQALAAAEIRGREILGMQFYEKFPVLQHNRELVDVLLEKKLDEIKASGKLNGITPQQGEKLKTDAFAQVAAEATGKIVRIQQQAKTIAAAAAPPAPPVTVSSAPAKPVVTTPVEPAPKTAADKYPKGSMSSVLAARRAAQSGAGA